MKRGIEIGLEGGSQGIPNISAPKDDFKEFEQPRQLNHHQQVSGYRLQSAKLRNLAQKAVKSGSIVSVFIFSRTALFHRIRYHPDGYWEQTGGLFGRSERSEPIFKLYSAGSRTLKENKRISTCRFPWQVK